MTQDPTQKEVQELREQMDAALADEEQLLKTYNLTDGAGENDVDHNLIRSCLYNNERGDGVLFSVLHRNKFVHVKTTGNWLTWADHHWQVDKKDLFHNAVENVASKYLEQSSWHKEQEEKAKVDEKKSSETFHSGARSKYNKRVNRLRGSKGAKACLEWSHKIGAMSLSIVGDEIDKKSWLLPCKNGVINLKTGKMVKGNPSDYLVKAIPVEWKGINEPCPNWEKFIFEIHLDDDLVASFVRRLFGYAITGEQTEHFIACFVGKGRNGKGTMFKIIQKIMGDLSWSIQPELILEQKNFRSSAGPSPDLISLQGRRLVVAAETDENRRISGSKVKALTGGDMICARAPHDRFETNFLPTHKLFLHTNHAPVGLTKDYALLKRLLFIKYPLNFVDDPTEPNERQRDPKLEELFKQEASGILAWLVRGCLEWQEVGLLPPKKLKYEVDQLRIKEDTFLQFYTEMCREDPDQDVLFKELYSKFSEWFKEEVDEGQRYIPSKKKVSQWLVNRGLKKEKPGGNTTFYGLAFKESI